MSTTLDLAGLMKSHFETYGPNAKVTEEFGKELVKGMAADTAMKWQSVFKEWNSLSKEVKDPKTLELMRKKLFGE